MNRSIKHSFLVSICILFLGPLSIFAKEEKPAKPSAPKRKIEDKLVRTHHRVQIDHKTLAYTATTGHIVMKTEHEKPKAKIFFVAYTLDNIKDPGRRPITFAFNGGPGSSSVWLHLGALGPKRVVLDDEGFALPPPYQLKDNTSTILDHTDLVFIDPVTTGYSRAVEGESPHQFHGVREDIRSVGDFIRLYTSRFNRWASPKFLSGESYGTTRAAGLAGYLQRRYGMYLNGIVLISTALNFETLAFDPGNDLPYVLYLPSYTATAWYHHRLDGKLQQDLEKAVIESRHFADTTYSHALMKGDQIPPSERDAVAQKLAQLTGLSVEYVLQSNLRVPIYRFVKELLRDQRRTVGRLDSRFKGIDKDAAGSSYEFDPSYAAILGPFTATFNDYVRRELNYKSDLPYEILTGRVRPWNYNNAKNRYVNVAETLRTAMTMNPALHVFVANGYYDLATPFHATEYTIEHMGLEPELHRNITMTYYPAGHMMYIRKVCLKQLKAALDRFYTSTVRVETEPSGRKR